MAYGRPNYQPYRPYERATKENNMSKSTVVVNNVSPTGIADLTLSKTGSKDISQLTPIEDPFNTKRDGNYNSHGCKQIVLDVQEKLCFQMLACYICKLQNEKIIPPCFPTCGMVLKTGSNGRIYKEMKVDPYNPDTFRISAEMIVYLNEEIRQGRHSGWIFRNGLQSGVDIHHLNKDTYDCRLANISLPDSNYHRSRHRLYGAARASFFRKCENVFSIVTDKASLSDVDTYDILIERLIKLKRQAIDISTMKDSKRIPTMLKEGTKAIKQGKLYIPSKKHITIDYNAPATGTMAGKAPKTNRGNPVRTKHINQKNMK
jgi:hypothetical protein